MRYISESRYIGSVDIVAPTKHNSMCEEKEFLMMVVVLTKEVTYFSLDGLPITLAPGSHVTVLPHEGVACLGGDHFDLSPDEYEQQ